jgi:zinc carboxypeptidase
MRYMHLTRFVRASVVAGLIAAAALVATTPASADPPHQPGGPCLQPGQNVSLPSVAGYADVVQVLDRLERTSGGLVSVASAGRSGEGRELLYATVGTGPLKFWLQARIHGNELHSTEAVLQVLDYLTGGSPAARLIRDNLTVVVIPMYNPDGAEANIRQSTTPNRIDLNRDWENFAQPESVAFWRLWRDFGPQLALDLHHMGQAPVVDGTNDLNQFQIGARSIDPARMTAEQWLTNRRMAMASVEALDHYGLANVAHYPIIDITNAALSRMLMGGTAPAGEQPVAQTPTRGAIFYEVRSVGQKSNGQLENLFRVPTMAVLTKAANGSLVSQDISGYPALPFATQGPCGVV